MNEELEKELEQIVLGLVKQGASHAVVQERVIAFREEHRSKKDSSKKAEPDKGKDVPVEEHVALTVDSATDDDIAAVSIDTGYWAKVEDEQGLTRDQVVDMSTIEGPVRPEHREMLEKVSKEEKLIKSVKGSGDEVSLNADYSDPKKNFSKVVMEPFAKYEDSEYINFNKTANDLNAKYTRYGFTFKRAQRGGPDGISITADFDGGKIEETEDFRLNSPTVRADMDAWMAERAVDKLADLGEHLDDVGITADDRKTAAETSEAEYDNYLKNVQDLEDAQDAHNGTGEVLEGNEWYDDIISNFVNPNTPAGESDNFALDQIKREAYNELMGMTPANIKIRTNKDPRYAASGEIVGTNEFIQARSAVAERTFRENLEDLSQEEKGKYRLTPEDRKKISTIAEGIDKNDPEVRRIAIDLLSKQKEEGLLGERIADVRSDYDHEVLEALGKEKLAKLTEKQEEVLSESLVVKEKYGAVSKLLKAAGDDIKNYDAGGKIKAIQSREFKTQEDVDAAKSEIAEIVSTHEKLAADYGNKLRNYELIEDAAKKTNKKITNLQVDIEDIGAYTELVGLDYGMASRMGASLINATIDLVQGGVSFGELVLDTVGEISKAGIMASGTPAMRGALAAYEHSHFESPSVMDKAHAAVDTYQAEWSDSMYHMQYDDIDSAADFGEWFAVMMAGQVPNLALMAATGPASLYIMGITSTGQKYLDLKGQNKLYAETGGLYGNEYSFGEMFLNSTVSGLAEALSEKITLGQLGAAKGVFKGLAKSKGVRDGVGNYLKKHVFSSRALKATGKDLLEEGGSEAIATISGNVMDIWAGNREAGFWDGVEESFVSGVAMSGTLKSPMLAKHAMAAFSSPDTDAVREENLIRINELSDTLLKKDHELSPEAKEAIEEEIAELTVETTAMLEQDIKRVDILSDNDKKKLLGIERNKRKVLARWEAIQKDESLSETEKEALKDRLQNKLNAFGATKAEMLSQYDPNVADTKYSETTMPLKSPDQQFEENIEFAKKHSALYGMEVDDGMTAEQIREKYGDDAAGSDGFVDGNNIVINREVAAATGAVTVGSHELLHGILKKEMAKPGGISEKVISQLKKEIGSQWSVVQQRIDDNYTKEYMDANPDEYLTIVSDAIAKKEIVYEETTFDKLRDAFNEIPMFKKYFPNIKFNTGKDVYRFLREYNKSIHKGALSSDIIKATQGETDAAAGEKKMSMTSGQKKAAAAGVKKLGTDNTNKSWRRGGADAAIKEMKDKGWFDALIASQYKVKPVPKDFVDKVYSEITPHIKRFKPEQNDDLFAYVNSQIGNKAGNVYNREYKVDDAMQGAKDIDAKTTEGAPVIQVEAETDSEVTKFEEQDMSPRAQARRTKLAKEGKSESDKYSGLRTELGLEKPMMDKVRNVVMKTFGTKLPDVNSKKFKAALQKAYRNELKKPIQDMIGKGEVYNEFLAKNFPTVFKFLPKETLLQMERNVAPENRIFTKSERITKSAEVDRLISEGLLPKDTNRTSGPTLITKLPYPGTKKVMAYFRGQDMGNTLGYKVGASTLGTRKDKLAMEMGVELGFDATMETLEDPAVQDRRQGILELQGFDQKNNETAVIGKQINRDPSIKFSKSSKETAESSPNKILEKTGSSNPVVFRKGPVVSAKTGEVKLKKLADFGRELRVDGALMELGKHTTDVLSSFAKSFPQYLSDLRTTMSGGQGLSFFGLTSVFDKLALGLKVGPKLAERFTYSGKGKNLNPNKVSKSGGKLKFKQGRETLSRDAFVEQQSKKLDVLEALFTAIQSHLKDNPSHAWFFARMVSDTVNNQNSIIRVLAPTMAFPTDGNGNLVYDQKIAEEHSFPQNNVGTLLLEAAITGKDIKEVMKIVRGSYMQMALLEVHDDKVRQAGYASKMPDVFWDKVVPRLVDGSLGIKNGLASMVRYAESGVDLNNYIVPGENQTITEYFGVGRYPNASQTLVDKQNELITKFLTGEITKKEATSVMNEFVKVEGIIESSQTKNTDVYDQAVETTVKYSKTGEAKGMSAFDFDETLIIDGENFIIATDPATGQQLEVKSNEWPLKGPELAAAGFEFDFSDFTKVRGGKEGPLLQKMKNQISKYGPKNVFVLTARQQDSAQPIHEWLKSQGVNIPIENITGLGNSEGSAKGEWMLQKFAEGYNDMYFVDDAMPNVKAVKDVLDRFDIKGKAQQARIKFSKSGPKKMADILGESALNIDIILEQTKGVGREKGFSTAKAKQRGKGKGKFKFFLPPSAEDFAGLVYSFLGKGKQGEKHHAWFKDNLFDPYSKGIRQINTVKQLVAKDMRSLRRALPKVKKVLKNTVPGTEYTHEQAIRVYNWAKAGMDIPGLSKADQKKLISIVENDSQLKAFADGVNSIAATPGGLQAPTDSWLAGTIPSDMNDAMDASREKYLEPWLHNKNIIFSEQALNKIEAVYGSNFREALEDVLFRMEHNSNRTSGQGRLLGGFMDWINGSIGATMFFNSRSAVLQTMSSVNFINWSDNNPLKAAAAFANQKQYWTDVAMIFNSPFLKQRRSGLAQDVNTAELAEAIKGAANPARAAIGYLLQLGFTPTQVADSFAIASGGATMYRNRIKSLMEGGMTQKEAEAQAFTDFMEIAEETQQSARPDRISQQQASPLGKVILAFQNTPMQYNRLMKKAMLDLVNGRGDAKTHMSKILYYGAIQNAIFYSLQTALYAMLFGDDDEDEEERQEAMDKKTSRVVNGMIDGLLRGAGIGGAVVSTLKNVVLEHLNQKKKLDDDKFYTDYQEGEVVIELLNLSPPIGIKARKISSGLKTWLYNRDVIDHMSKTDIDNPIYDSAFSITEGLTNIPLSRAHGKLMNLREAANSDHETWKRVSMFLGWNKWSFGIQNQDVLTAKGEVKAIKAEKAEEKREKKKEEKAIEKAEENKAIEEGFLEDQKAEIENKKKDDKIKCAAVTSSGKRCGKTILKGQSYCTIHESVEQNESGEKSQCKHIKKDGKRCKVKTANKSGLCYYHD
jgi:hypothetical protein